MLIALVGLAVWVVIGLPRFAAEDEPEAAAPVATVVAEPGAEPMRAEPRAPVVEENPVRTPPESSSLASPSIDREAPSEPQRRPFDAPDAGEKARENAAAEAADESGAELRRHITDGLAAVQARDLDSARGALERAASARPEAPAVNELRRQVTVLGAEIEVEAGLAAALRQESSEDWRKAVESYRRVLAVDSGFGVARLGLERSSSRAQLDDRLEAALASPERLTTDAVFEEARDLLEAASSIEPAGPRLVSQIDRLSAQIERHGVLVPVVLQSDGKTSILLQRIGDLGMFESRSLELRPGRYTVIGRREGYRDVRRVLEVSPDGASTLSVQCTQRLG